MLLLTQAKVPRRIGGSIHAAPAYTCLLLPHGTRALFKFVERGLASRSAATVNSVTPGVAMLCHQRVDDAWRALWPLNVTHARAQPCRHTEFAALAGRRGCLCLPLLSRVCWVLSPMPLKSKVDLVGNVRAKREQTYSLF